MNSNLSIGQAGNLFDRVINTRKAMRQWQTVKKLRQHAYNRQAQAIVRAFEAGNEPALDTAC
ncbi:MAG TPA: hypothetical protein V6D17_08595 [Candidatus Obscuribacterales bacterium]